MSQACWFWIETTYEGGLSKYTFPLCLWEDGRGKDQTSRRARPVILIDDPTWVIVVISAGGADLNSDWVAGSVWYELLDGQERRLEAVGSPQNGHKGELSGSPPTLQRENMRSSCIICR